MIKINKVMDNNSISIINNFALYKNKIIYLVRHLQITVSDGLH